MGYLYVVAVAIMFSFGGTCVKTISPYFGSEYITLFRFVVGVLWLLLLKAVKRQHFGKEYLSKVRTCLPVLLMGAVSKWLAYLTENYALARGLSYGNIITQPVQTVLLTVLGVILYHEKLSFLKAGLISLCVTGILLVSVNGRSLSVFLGQDLLFTSLFVISGICAGIFVLAQRMLADKMDILESNLTMFSMASVFALFPVLPSAGSGFVVHPDVPAILAIAAFGFITGIGFYLNAKAIPLIPFFMVPLLQNTMVIFSICWGILFFHERFTLCALVGTVLFLVGIVGLQLQTARAKASQEK